MEIQEIEKQKMDALRALSETNLEVSKVKKVLEDLKSDENVYIKEREEKVLAKIQTLLDESKEITKETVGNYTAIQDLMKETRILSQFVVEAHGELTELIKTFEETTKDWDAEVKNMQNELAEVRKQLKVEAIQIKNDQDSIEKRKKEVKNEERKVKDQRETLERALNRLKK